MAQVAKSPQALATYLATLAAGGVFVPLNTAYTRGEVQSLFEDAEPALLIADPQAPLGTSTSHTPVLTLDADGNGSLTAAAEDATPIEPVAAPLTSPAVMLFTSGTTGRPKGVPLTGHNLATNARMLHDAWLFGPDDRLLHMLPLFHVHGLFVALHPVLLAGGTLSFHGRFHPGTVIDDLDRCSVVMGVPTMYSRLLEQANLDRDRTRSIRLFACGSAPLTAQTHERFAERTGHAIVERYGMTEAGIMTSNPYDGDRIPGTVGYPFPGVRLRIVDDHGSSLPTGVPGNVQATGPNVFEGYWQRPDATADVFTDDGWLRTGDVGSLSVDGRLTLDGRASDLIISGGLNIAPRQIEEALESSPSIDEVAVVGIPHPDLGETVVAFVVADRFDEDAARSCLADLARFKHPKSYVELPGLPRNAMGKVEKGRLRDEYSGLFATTQTLPTADQRT